MDALALLCTLHAEGPRTLRLLREAGCRDVRDFLALDAEVVAALLDVAPAVARRLSREGRHLSQRIGSEFLEPEDGQVASQESRSPSAFGAAPSSPAGGALPFGVLPETEGVAPTPMPLPTPRGEERAVPATPRSAPTTQPVQPAEPQPAQVEEARVDEGRIPVDAYLNRSERQILDKVLERWRESDRDPLAESPADPPRADAVVEEVQAEVPARSKEPAIAPEPPVLLIEGVPEESLVALRAAGYLTPAAVRDANAMALAGAIGCAFGDARRFQFLAGRAVRRQETEGSFPAANRTAPVTPVRPRSPRTPRVEERPEPTPAAPTPRVEEPIAETDLAEHLIERPPVVPPSPLYPKGGVEGADLSVAQPAPVPVPPSAPAQAPTSKVSDKPEGRTVLNWDFVAPASDAPAFGGGEADVEPGGPFA